MGTVPALGIDVSKQTLVVLLLSGETVQRGEFANTPPGITQMLSWLRKRHAPSVHACLEATGRYSDQVALALHQAGHTVSVVNPARIAAYAKSQLARNKTDPSDAALIARFCQKEQPAAWTPPAPEVQELRALVRHREALQEMRQQEANRLGSGSLPAAVSQAITAHLTLLDQQVAELTSQIDAHVDRHPELKRQRELMASVKSIGKHTATLLLAEYGDLRQFGRARQVVAFAGLNPCEYRSGTSVRKQTRLSKIGNAAIRKALFFPALSAVQHNPVIRALRERLLARGKSKMAIIGAAMRKLLHLVYGVVKSGKPFDPAYGQQARV